MSTHRERLLGQARADLVALPVDEVWCLDCWSVVLVIRDMFVCSGCDREAPIPEPE